MFIMFLDTCKNLIDYNRKLRISRGGGGTHRKTQGNSSQYSSMKILSLYLNTTVHTVDLITDTYTALTFTEFQNNNM